MACTSVTRKRCVVSTLITHTDLTTSPTDVTFPIFPRVVLVQCSFCGLISSPGSESGPNSGLLNARRCSQINWFGAWQRIFPLPLLNASRNLNAALGWDTCLPRDSQWFIRTAQRTFLFLFFADVVNAVFVLQWYCWLFNEMHLNIDVSGSVFMRLDASDG